MKPKIAENVPSEDWELFEQVRHVINSLPATLKGSAYVMGMRVPREIAMSNFIPECHVFTRALAKFLPVDVHDGLITELRGENAKQHHHSWLTRKGSDGNVIIDPWPLGAVSGPALFIQDYAFHFGNEQTFSFLGEERFKSRVAVTRYVVRKILKVQSQHTKAAT